MTKLEEIAQKMAEQLTTQWSIGTNSQFCDDPPDWDPASEADIAAVLLPFLEEVRQFYEPPRSTCG